MSSVAPTLISARVLRKTGLVGGLGGLWSRNVELREMQRLKSGCASGRALPKGPPANLECDAHMAGGP